MFKTASPITWLFKLIIAIISLPIVGPFKLAKALNRRVYTSWKTGGWHALWGFVSSVAAASGMYRLVAFGGELGFPLFGWNAFFAVPHHGLEPLGFALLAFAFVAIYGYALAWLAVVQWFWRTWNAYYKAMTKFFSKNSGGAGTFEANGTRIARSITKVFRILPGSQKMWDKLVAQQETSFIIGLQAVLVAAGLIWATSKVGFAVYSVFHHLIAASVVGALTTTLGLVIALFVAGIVAYPVYKFLRTGKTYALGIVASFFSASFVCTDLVAGGATWMVWAAPIATVWLVNAYAYPAVTLFFSNNFLKKLYKKIEPYFNKAYDDKSAGFKELFQQSLNVSATAALVAGLWMLMHVAVLPIGLSVAWLVALPLVAFAAYSLLGEMMDWSGGNYVIGAVFSLAVAAFAFFMFGGYSTGWQHVLLVAIPVAIVSGVANFYLVFPFAYLTLKGIFSLPLIGSLTNLVGGLLHKAHTASWKTFEKVSRACEAVYSRTYRDDTDFRKLANHFFNIVVAVLVTGFVCHLSKSTGAAWATSLYGVVAFLLTYLLGKKLVFRTNVRQAGYLTAIVKVVVLTALLKNATPFGFWFALPVGAVGAAVCFFLIFPMLYLAFKTVLDPWFTRLALPVADATYGFISSRFNFVIEFGEKVYKFFAPFFNWLIKLFAAGWQIVSDAWGTIFGRR